MTGIFKTVMKPNIVQNVAVQFFLSTPYQVTKNSWLVLVVLAVTSFSGKIQKMLMLAHH